MRHSIPANAYRRSNRQAGRGPTAQRSAVSKRTPRIMVAYSSNAAPPRGLLVSAKPRAKSSAAHQPYDQKISNRSRDRLNVVSLLQPGALPPPPPPERRAKFQ